MAAAPAAEVPTSRRGFYGRQFPDTEIDRENTLVMVSGANGFVATHIIEQLLELGYKVRGTVRPGGLAKPEKIDHLNALAGADERLELVEADLLDADSYDAAVEGCDYVMHTASPYALNVKDPQKDLVDPAIEGTTNVLNACVKHGIKKVIVTSSMAAITDSPEEGHVYTEADWNTESSLKRNPYYFSKVEAEKVAQAICEENNIPLAVMNPFIVIGPEYSPSINESNNMIKSILTKELAQIMDIHWCFIDVRDVAAAHIISLENPSALGRFLIINETHSMKEVVTWMSENGYADYDLPTTSLACKGGSNLLWVGSWFLPKGTGAWLRTNLGRKCLYDTSKVQSLGLEYTPWEVSMHDAIASLVARGKIEARGPWFNEDGSLKDGAIMAQEADEAAAAAGGAAADTDAPAEPAAEAAVEPAVEPAAVEAAA